LSSAARWNSMTSKLLATDEPTPVAEHNAGSASPFLLVCDHAGRRIPKKLGDLGLAEPELSRHIAWDIGIEGVGRRLSERLAAHLVMQVYSRLVIDCNRPPNTEESIPAESDATVIPGNIGLCAADSETRRLEIFDPYHNMIEKRLDARKAAECKTILISLHSFTPVYGGVARPWHAGLLYNRYNGLAHPLRDALRAGGEFVIGDMEPYTVDDETDYTVPVHGEARGIPHVAIEIRQDLIAAPADQVAWADRLAELLPKAAAGL
jgi:predicted N-formylglutamate amidohydrolase